MAVLVCMVPWVAETSLCDIHMHIGRLHQLAHMLDLAQDITPHHCPQMLKRYDPTSSDRD